MIGSLHRRAADRRIIGGSTLRSITPWIVAVMSFTILLIAATGLIVTSAASTLERSISNRFSLEVPGGADVEMLAERMRALPGIASADPVSEAEMRDTLEKWLGRAAASPDLPVPALVDFDLDDGADAGAVRRALARLEPAGEVVEHGDSVAPLLGSLLLLQWVALALVLLLGLAASAAVVLAARGAMDTNRPTVEVLHGIGATDAQISELFQRRIASETLVGALGGALLAGLVMVTAAGGAYWAGEMAGLRLGPKDMLVLALLPFALTAAATLAARAAIHSILASEP